MNLFAGQQWRRRWREQTWGHCVEERGWDKLRVETYILSHVKQPAGICGVTWGAQPSALLQPTGVGDRREVQEGGDICIPVTDSC